MTRRLIVTLVAVACACWTPRADAQTASPTLLWACYVPLTGTVYRIDPAAVPTLKIDCSTPSHVKFSFAGGASSGGGVTGYEVMTATVSNSYSTLTTTVTEGSYCANYVQSTPLRGGYCETYYTWYHVARHADAAAVVRSCATGKKAFGVLTGGDLTSDINADGSVIVSIPPRDRVGRSAASALGAPDASYPLPPDTPDSYSVKLVCANAS